MKEKSGGDGKPIALTLALALLAILVSAVIWQQLWGASHLLINEKGAQWIRFPEPFRLRIHFAKKITTVFRKTVKSPLINKKAFLTFRSAGEATVFLGQKAVFFDPSPDTKRSKEKHRVDLSPFLEPGNHELRIVVSNTEGHPLLIAYSEDLGLFTGENWEASKDGLHWLPAVSAEKTNRLAISQTVPRLGRSIRSLALFYISVFLLFFFWSIRNTQDARQKWPIKRLPAATVRWFVLLAWLVMAINNFWKLPLEMGMDYKGHMQYILYLVENRRIPLATEGWQMFQQPLYYFLTSGIYGFLHEFFSDEASIRAMKLFSVFCGMLQIEISYQMIKLLYPGRESIQTFGVILAGFIPMNLYMSQSLGNEPLAGLLTALMILTAVRLALRDAPADREQWLLMGFLLGLALLAKVSTILIVLPVLSLISTEIIIKNGLFWKSVKSSAGFILLVLLVAFSVSAWYYINNYIEMGSFFKGGWDLSREIVWWQDPGYRTLRQLYSFGESLYNPVFSSIYGIWDALYSSFWADGFLSAYYKPPWNYPFLITGMWLSLFPSAAIVIGVVAAVRMTEGKLRRVLLFSAGSVLLYLAAILYMFITVPFLSSAKASYTLGLIPCFALLGAAGFDILIKNRYIGAFSHALFACWATAAFLSYFVI